MRMLQLFKARHRASRFDLVIIWNLKHPQIVCADYAVRRMRVPVVLEYEDDAFVSIDGRPTRHSFGYRDYASKTLREACGGIACAPQLLAQLPADIPKLLIRGVVGADLVSVSQQSKAEKRNWVLFSGTHCNQYGNPSLITGWGKAGLPDWELHITGDGPDTVALRKLAETNRSIRFHGLLSRPELVRLMCSARICINPHEISKTPGNVFAFKIVEYLAAGAHVITTPMGASEEEIERGITYMPDNKPDTIASTLQQVITNRFWERTAAQYAIQTYGSAAVARSLDRFMQQVMAGFTKKPGSGGALVPTDHQPIPPQKCLQSR
jgi:glycosyltransferase involved in cell wall biosynthesis